jgi:hypothetical protein
MKLQLRKEARLGEYIATKYRPRRKERDIKEIKIADVLTIYTPTH